MDAVPLTSSLDLTPVLVVVLTLTLALAGPLLAGSGAPGTPTKEDPDWFDFDEHRFWYPDGGAVISWEERPEAVAYDVYLIRYRDGSMSRPGLLSASHRGVQHVEVEAGTTRFVDAVAPDDTGVYEILGYQYVAVFARDEDGRRTDLDWEVTSLPETELESPYVHRCLPFMDWVRVWPDEQGIFLSWSPPPAWLPETESHEIYVSRPLQNAPSPAALQRMREEVFSGEREGVSRYETEGLATSLVFPAFEDRYALVIAVDADGNRYGVRELVGQPLGDVPEADREGAYRWEDGRFVAPGVDGTDEGEPQSR